MFFFKVANIPSPDVSLFDINIPTQTYVDYVFLSFLFDLSMPLPFSHGENSDNFL